MDIADRAWQKIYDMYLDAYGKGLFEILVPDRNSSKGEQIKNHCGKYPEWIFICEENKRVVGFVTFFLDYEKRIGEIGNNAVGPDAGLKGIGQQMYKAVLKHFTEEGMTYAKVATGLDDAHAPARRAYERAGFDIKVEDVTYYKKL